MKFTTALIVFLLLPWAIVDGDNVVGLGMKNPLTLLLLATKVGFCSTVL
jgi:hypothetical protein